MTSIILSFELSFLSAVAGGHHACHCRRNIRDIAINAAFLAADAAEPLRMLHVLAAARSEYAKLERPLTVARARGGG